jgi:ABC-2 type transport system ATP-binding protein
MMNNIAIEVEHLKVIRGKNTVIPGLDLTVKTGSVSGLLGPSGSGKSTLIRAIAGVQIVAAGSVTVLGAPAGSAINRRRVGYVTQASSVYPDLSVRQNLAYFSALAGKGAAAIDETIGKVGLTSQADQLTGNLSGGQRIRVSLAAALLADPELYLLDELRRDLWKMFDGLAADGKTLLVSSHVMDEAGRCDRVLLMRDGGLIADATPDGLRTDAGTDDLEEAFLVLAERDAA